MSRGVVLLHLNSTCQQSYNIQLFQTFIVDWLNMGVVSTIPLEYYSQEFAFGFYKNNFILHFQTDLLVFAFICKKNRCQL